MEISNNKQDINLPKGATIRLPGGAGGSLGRDIFFNQFQRRDIVFGLTSERNYFFSTRYRGILVINLQIFDMRKMLNDANYFDVPQCVIVLRYKYRPISCYEYTFRAEPTFFFHGWNIEIICVCSLSTIFF